MTGLVEKAFDGGLSTPEDYKIVWLAFIDFIVRQCVDWADERQVERVREAFNRANQYLTSNLGDRDCVILQYWAYLEAKKMNNMPRARELWKEIMMQCGHNKSAQWRLTCIQFER